MATISFWVGIGEDRVDGGSELELSRQNARALCEVAGIEFDDRYECGCLSISEALSGIERAKMYLDERVSTASKKTASGNGLLYANFRKLEELVYGAVLAGASELRWG